MKKGNVVDLMSKNPKDDDFVNNTLNIATGQIKNPVEGQKVINAAFVLVHEDGGITYSYANSLMLVSLIGSLEYLKSDIIISQTSEEIE